MDHQPGPPAEVPDADRPDPAPGRRDGPVVARTCLLVGAAVAALGVPYGVAWALLAPEVPVRLTERGLAYAEAQPEQVAAADGWFAILAVPVGVLAGIGVWLLARRLRGVPGMLALVGGGIGAGLVAWQLGRRIGRADYRAELAAAEPGTQLARPADLGVAELSWWPPWVAGVLLVPAMAAVITYTLLAAWSRFPDLRGDELPGEPGAAVGPGGDPTGPATR